MRSERGQSLVEFALALPILVLLLFAVIQFGVVFNNYVTLTDATRAGARNSAADQTHIDSAHDHIAALAPAAHANDQTNDSEDAARSGEPLPTIRVVERADPDALRAELLESARKAGEAAAKRLTG